MARRVRYRYPTWGRRRKYIISPAWRHDGRDAFEDQTLICSYLLLSSPFLSPFLSNPSNSWPWPDESFLDIDFGTWAGGIRISGSDLRSSSIGKVQSVGEHIPGARSPLAAWYLGIY
ncbi:hypothetical protein B0H13DRAFT_1881310 [Mycena leptocephala]|nr:hypothetical protein B0H13DRAFT_1881310 [Mycena leptocephala]